MPSSTDPSPYVAPRADAGSWPEVARVFGRLGLTAFGGPAAHIAAMEDEIVKRRQWISRDDFVDLVGASNLIPGPNSTELAIHIGYRRAGWPGLIAAGVSFIVPAVVLVWVLAIAYVHGGSRLDVSAILAGLQPVVLAVVVQALWRLRASLVRSRWAALVAAASVVAVLAGVSEVMVLVLALLASVVMARVRIHDDIDTDHRPLAALGAAAATAINAPISVAMSAPAVFLSFAKIGSVLFGSGYVLLTFLRGEFVLRHAVLTDAQLLDAIAVGQVTPGPVFSAATFVGYLIAGHAGAAAATAGIFLPAFVGVALTAPYVARLRGSRRWSAALDGVNAASLALMASVILVMARHIAPDPVALAILSGASAVLVFTRIGSGWVLLAGACVGLLRALH
ncbi:chromate efflux transporter [Gemmatimonas sp.]|jgi:chromate transporter|uniref:chromate efflux transporter n=1 Tax=Gemmatimonas sp. TaxID=1962908 RepID=UPI0037BE4DC8